ncbi:FGGY family carbohydrate kinase [Burkholderia anthina]|uniref:xylulokinase n=1 Tax=Burkholderia anthina TaxID=179879 RepID=UPI0015889FD1
MSSSVIACDLGTGSAKVALFRHDGVCLADCVVRYDTYYPGPKRHEQRVSDWWDAVVAGIRDVMSRVQGHRVGAIALSGHSLGCVPLGAGGRLLAEHVPIWSDSRADEEADAFFAAFDFRKWYARTGNGFPAPLYPLFKAMWLRRNRPDVYTATEVFAGTKDYVNLRLTGRLVTDPSYASGSGAYDLHRGDYCDEILAAAGLSRAQFPTIVPSTAVVGEVLPDVAAALGLPPGVKVIAGGVDNSCMALGAGTFRQGDAYCSMGSSSWLTIAARKPLIDQDVVPYVFQHVVPDMFISATSIFSSGTSIKWVLDTFHEGLHAQAARDAADGVEAFVALAAQAPFGARGLLFVPTLGGGTTFEGGPDVRGALLGLDLQHGAADVARATLEGVALALAMALDALRGLTDLRGEMTIVGGGAKSPLLCQILADYLRCTIAKTAVDQQAAALGAAALALVGTEQWADFTPIIQLQQVSARAHPDPGVAVQRDAALRAYRQASEQQRALAPALAALRQAVRVPAPPG